MHCRRVGRYEPEINSHVLHYKMNRGKVALSGAGELEKLDIPQQQRDAVPAHSYASTHASDLEAGRDLANAPWPRRSFE